MNCSNYGQLSVIVLDEIALDGLEGLTLDGLWARLSVVLNLKLPLLDHFKNIIWSFVKQQKEKLLFYVLATPRAKLKVFIRQEMVDPDTGLPSQPVECPFTIYPYKPIEDVQIRGSCESYYERKEIPFEKVSAMSIKEVEEKWGDKFIVVASQILRERALYPRTISPGLNHSILQYCLLERIGRARYNGEITFGKHSLANFCNDAKLMFYVRNKLIEQKLLVRQPYSEKMYSTISTGCLLTLPRFFVEFKTKAMWYLESVIQILKSRPHGMAEIAEIRSSFGEGHEMPLKKLFNMPLFKKYVVIENKVPYRQVYPEAAPSEWQCKNKDEERMIRALKLRDINLDLDELWKTEEFADESTKNESNTAQRQAYIDMPLRAQILKVVADFGKDGVSQTDLANILGIKRIFIRQLLKVMTRESLVTYYLSDLGRQRLKTYVLPSNLHNSTNYPEKIDTDDCAAELSTTAATILQENLDDTVEEEPIKKIIHSANVEVRVEDAKLTELWIFKKPLNETKFTLRQRQRKKMILSLLKTVQVIDIFKLNKIIYIQELKLGYKDKMCKKSLIRLLWFLRKKNQIRVYDAFLKWKDYNRFQRYVTADSVDLEHPKLKNVIEKWKSNISYIIAQNCHREKLKEKALEICANKTGATKDKTQNFNELKIKISRRSSPKFIRMQLLHEILFYLAYEIRDGQKCYTSEEAIKEWKQVDPSINYVEVKTDLPIVYSLALDWKIFVKPLPEYTSYPSGWVNKHDVLLRMPLSLYAKIHNLRPNINPLLDMFLKHPIRRHYLISQLPAELQEFLHADKIPYTCIDDVLKRLCLAGLIQFGAKQSKDRGYTLLFLNRNLKILDTSPSEGGYMRISNDKKYEELHFKLLTTQDAAKYWSKLHHICMTTKLGLRSMRNSKSEASMRNGVRNLDLCRPVPDFVGPEEAVVNDIGILPGDNEGAAGLDTAFFAHVKKNWSWSAKPQKITQRRVIPAQTVRFSKLLRAKESVSLIQRKSSTITLMPSGRVNIKRRVILDKIRRIKKMTYDTVDKEALKRMDKLRVSWSIEEDRLLIICRVACLYLNPHNVNYVSCRTIRDVLHFGLNSLNKTSRACQRRLVYMIKNKSTQGQILVWLQEANQSQYINQLFGRNFLANLKKVYSTLDDQLSAVRIYFVQLVYYLNKILTKESKYKDNGEEREYILPETLAQFRMVYRQLESPYSQPLVKHLNPTNKTEVDISTINALVHSSVCCSKDKTLYNIQLFEIYKNYEEDTLAKAFKKVRDDRMIVIKKGIPISSYKTIPLNGKTYHISNAYCHQFFLMLPYSIIDQYFKAFQGSITKFFGPNNSTAQSNSIGVDYMTVSPGTCFFIAEMARRPDMVFNIETPKQVLKVDVTQETDVKSTEKILERFREIFRLAPNPDYTKHFETEAFKSDISEKSVRFNFGEETHHVRTSPYDFINKLADSHIHFFCILNSLNKEYVVDFGIMNEENLCPFEDCIMQSDGFMNTIERLTEDHRSMIANLSTSPLSEDLTGEAVKLTPRNVMIVYNQIQKRANTILEQANKKDFGKLKISRARINITYLLNEVLEYSDIDQDDDDESEQTLSKELSDKVSRIQDMLIVNTPKLTISSIANGSEDRVSFDNSIVPRNLVSAALKRNQILNKIIQDALWQNVELSIDELETCMEEEGFTKAERNLTLQILEYMKSSEIGITARELVAKFKDEKLLVKCIEILRRKYFIKRVGVHSHMYVHGTYIRPWVIHTYNIKRLEKETIPPSILVKTKRKQLSPEREDISSGDQSGENLKKLKLEKSHDVDSGDVVNTEEVPTKRASKPSRRFADSYYTNPAATITKAIEKERIIMRPCPWMRVNGSVNRRVLDKWLGTILMECITGCGQIVTKLFSRFDQLHPVHILFLLEILTDIDCVKLKVNRIKKSTLFSKHEPTVIEDATEFSPLEDTFVVPTPNCVLNMALFIGEKKYLTDFI